MARLEDEIDRLREEIDAFLAVQPPPSSVELAGWQREAIEYLARGERVPDGLLEGKDELSAQFMRVLEEMRDEGYFSELLGDNEEGDED